MYWVWNPFIDIVPLPELIFANISDPEPKLAGPEIPSHLCKVWGIVGEAQI
jgi:hypothetical protein